MLTQSWEKQPYGPIQYRRSQSCTTRGQYYVAAAVQNESWITVKGRDRVNIYGKGQEADTLTVERSPCDGMGDSVELSLRCMLPTSKSLKIVPRANFACIFSICIKILQLKDSVAWRRGKIVLKLPFHQNPQTRGAATRQRQWEKTEIKERHVKGQSPILFSIRPGARKRLEGNSSFSSWPVVSY